MRYLLIFSALFVAGFASSTSLKAEEAADAQVAKLTAEVAALKALAKAAEGGKNAAELRLEIYKRGYDKLLDEVNAQQSLFEMKKAATKISADIDTDNARLDDVLAGKKPK